MLPPVAERQQHAFDPDVCDLCACREWRSIGRIGTGRALRSDRTILPEDLEKRVCLGCGLGRRGTTVDPEALERLYEEDYRGGAPRAHVFYTTAGPVPRSDAFADWFLAAAGDAFEGARRGLECGAGTGELVAALARRCPHVALEAFEPRRDRADRAPASGARAARDVAACEDGAYDVVWAVAVLEHVAAPARFLRGLRRLLRPGGHLILAQPTQDVKSTDIAFVDHLFHFGTAHLRHYARACGFREIRCAVGHPLMPTYSLHLWRRVAVDPVTTRGWVGPPAATCVDRSARELSSDLKLLDGQLDACRTANRRAAAFGLGETFWIARCYSHRLDAALVCGAVDEPERDEYASLGFPIVTPERLPAFGVDVVFLTMSPQYHDRAASRIAALGLTPVSVLPSFGGPS